MNKIFLFINNYVDGWLEEFDYPDDLEKALKRAEEVLNKEGNNGLKLKKIIIGTEKKIIVQNIIKKVMIFDDDIVLLKDEENMKKEG